MLESLELKNFTAFREAKFEFAKGLNVLVGENGTGKSHVLKLAYSIATYSRFHTEESKNVFDWPMAEKLISVFRPDALGSLITRGRRSRLICKIVCSFSEPRQRVAFSFSAATKTEVELEEKTSSSIGMSVYLPTRELLTIYPGFVPLYESKQLSFEETWKDTCNLLGAPLNKSLKEKKQLIAPLEEAMGGTVEIDPFGRFCLNVDGVTMDMNLVAEGFRKLAMIARLIANGSLSDRGHLFWDEPEANLNPKIVKLIAQIILRLCKGGIQVFIASHSLFLLRELDILLQTGEFKKIEPRYFGLHRGEHSVEVEQGDSVDSIGDIDVLEEELSQSDR